MAGVPEDGGDLDSAGVYFMTVEEFESRSEKKVIRESRPSAKGDPSGGEPINSHEEVDEDSGDRRGKNRRG
jgi:hypothetical protein